MFNSMAVWDQEMGDGDIFIGCKDEFCCQVVMVIMVMVMTSCCCPLGLFLSKMVVDDYHQDCWSVGLLELDLPVKLIQSSPSGFSCPYRLAIS